MSQRLPGKRLKDLASPDDGGRYSLVPAEIWRKPGYEPQGLSDIVLTAVLPPSTGESGPGSWAGYAMPRNWLGAMIAQVALRVGGSSLYYWTGDQILIDTLTDCEESGKKQAVMNLGGGELLKRADFAGALSNVQPGLTGSIYIKMPFNSISALQKTLPLNTDLLTQPVQILITFKQFSEVAYWYGGDSGPVPSNLPTQFQRAQVNFRKTTLQNSEHLLSRREDMLKKALTIPLRYFAQTTFRTNVTASAGQANTINLTGFRSGSVKYIDIWATPISGGAVPAGSNWNFVPFTNVKLLINGLVMYDSQDSNNAMWSLCERKTPAQVDTTTLTDAGDHNSAVASPSVMPWCVIPFAQLSEPMAYESDVVSGFPIQNSVINLSVTFPDSGDYQISSAYHYSASLVATRNTMEYVF